MLNSLNIFPKSRVSNPLAINFVSRSGIFDLEDVFWLIKCRNSAKAKIFIKAFFKTKQQTFAYLDFIFVSSATGFLAKSGHPSFFHLFQCSSLAKICYITKSYGINTFMYAYWECISETVCHLHIPRTCTTVHSRDRKHSHKIFLVASDSGFICICTINTN